VKIVSSKHQMLIQQAAQMFRFQTWKWLHIVSEENQFESFFS